MKKVLSIAALTVACIGATAALTGCKKTDTTKYDLSDGGNIINIRCWNDEFQGILRNNYKGFDHTDADGNDVLKNGKKIKWSIVPNENLGYQNALDDQLKKQSTAAADEKVDLFLVEADYALKYVNSSYAVNVNNLGLSDEDLSDQYEYTKQIVRDANGFQKGTSWQAAPGLFAYRADIARDVWGTDDPDTIQAKISDWSKFNAAAAEVKAKGRYMLSGYEDSYRAFSNNTTNKLVNGTKINIDSKLWEWVNQTKEFTDKGYSHGTVLWSGDWTKDQGPEGNVFGFFYSTWGINFTLKGNALADKNGEEKVGNGLFGEYRVCKGPASYYWGGTWLVGANGTDNKAEVRDIMYELTCNKSVMKAYSLKSLDYTNTKSGMNEIGSDTSYHAAFLGGQNHFKLFNESAAKVNCSNITKYDQGINEKFQESMRDYYAGKATKEAATETFYGKIKEIYPVLTK